MKRILAALSNGNAAATLKWLGAAAFCGMIYAQFQGVRHDVGGMKQQVEEVKEQVSRIAETAGTANAAIISLTEKIEIRVENADKEHATINRRIERLEEKR